ncbi:T9SS type A sorting domain-containing protein [Portibacter lacus]|nr:T9SS type A sorting domain-containing protein [Portibacter lacus]
MKINLPKFLYGSMKLICFTVCLFFNSIILTAQQECNLYCTCNGNCTISGTYNNNATFVNQGILEIRGVFNNYDYFENTNNLNNRGSFQNDGLFDNNNYSLNIGTFNNLGTFNNSDIFENTTIFVNHGIIENTGSFTGGGSIYNYRTLSISNSPDTLDLGDNALVFYMNEPEVIPKYISKIGSSINDLISTSGSVTFLGELEVLLNDGKIPSEGEEFTIMTYGSRSGTFDTVILPSGYNWSLDYGETELTLTMNSLVPVDLLLFSGDSKINGVQLNWISSSEINNDYFEVERSVDGVNFETIGKVDGNGSSSMEHSYSFTDRSSLMVSNYYRLRQVDYDGSFSYSKIISVDRRNTDFAYQIGSNPIHNDVLDIKFFERNDDGIILSLSDINGRILFSKSIHNKVENIQLDNYDCGIYLLIINNKRRRYVERIVIP